MNHVIIAGAALALGGLVSAGPAQAVSPLSLRDTATIVIPAGDDEENAEIYHDLQTGVTPPKAMVGDDAIGGQNDSAAERPKGETEGAAKSNGNGDIEEKELQEDGLLPR